MIFIETERLILRSWNKETDLPVFIQMNQDNEVMEFFLSTLSPEESENFYNRIQKEFSEYGFGLYAIETKENKEFIGYTGLHHTTFDTDFSPCIEIGWRLKKKAWGKGYATEAAKACMNYTFNILKLEKIYSFTSCINKRSENVMKKAGMEKCGEFNHPVVPTNNPLCTHVLYIKQRMDE